MVFYRYLDQEQAVLVVHVLHSAQDLETLLEDDL